MSACPIIGEGIGVWGRMARVVLAGFYSGGETVDGGVTAQYAAPDYRSHWRAKDYKAHWAAIDYRCHWRARKGDGMAVVLDGEPLVSAGDERNAAVDLTDFLDTGESLASVSSVTADSTELTVSQEAVTTSEMRIKDRNVAAAKGITWHTVGFTAGNLYKFTIQFTTDASDAQTINADAYLRSV